MRIETIVTSEELSAIRAGRQAEINFQPMTEEVHRHYTELARERANKIMDAESISPEKIRGNCYYISHFGSDEADGRSPESAWQTIERLHRAFETQEVTAGDGVFFERGSEWNSRFHTETMGDYALLLMPGITYSAYGTGRKPVFMNCLSGSGKEKWRETEYPNVWAYTGNAGGRYGDVGNIVCDGGKAYGIKVTPDEPNHPYQPGVKTVDSGMVTNKMEVFHSGDTLFPNPGGLCNNLEFFHDYEAEVLYLYFDRGNPGEYFTEIMISRRGNVLRSEVKSTDIMVDNLCVKYGGSHGMNLVDCENVTIQNCELGWIGGSLQEMTGTVRYGNAIENWGECDGFYIRSCVVYECYDAQLTTQYISGEPACIMQNIEFSGNVLAFSNSPIELWNNNTPEKLGTENENQFLHVRVMDNYMFYSGYQFGHQRPVKNGSFGCLGAKGFYEVFKDTEITDNVMLYSAVMLHYTRSVGYRNSPYGIMLDRNVYAMQKDKKYYAKSCEYPETNEGSARLYPYSREALETLVSLGTEENSVFYWYDSFLFPEEEQGVYLMLNVWDPESGEQ